MPVVRAGLGHDVELSACRMSVLRGELIRQKRELRHRFLNNRLCWAVCINLVVVDAVD